MRRDLRPLLGLAVNHHAHHRNRKSGHPHHRHRIPKNQNRHDGGHRRLRISEHLQRQSARMFRHQKIRQVDQIRHRRIPGQQKQNPRIRPRLLGRDRRHIPFDIKRDRKQNPGCHGRHKPQEIHRVKLLPFGVQQNPLHDRFESPTGGGADADEKPKKVKQGLAITGQNDPKDDGQKREVNPGGLPLASDEEGENGGEEGRGGADGLVEGDGEVAERGVAADDGEAENGAEGEDFEELATGLDVLGRNDFEEEDREVAVEGTGEHVEHGQEDGEAEAIEAQEVLVQEEDADVRQVPGQDDQGR